MMSTKTGVDAKTSARKRFEDVWEVIRAELLAHFEAQRMPIEAREWYKRVSLSLPSVIEIDHRLVQNLDYNTPGGKLNRGMSVVDSVQILRGRLLTENEYLKAAILGWCVELVSLYYFFIFSASEHVYSYKHSSSSRTILWISPLRVEDNHAGIEWTALEILLSMTRSCLRPLSIICSSRISVKNHIMLICLNCSRRYAICLHWGRAIHLPFLDVTSHRDGPACGSDYCSRGCGRS